MRTGRRVHAALAQAQAPGAFSLPYSDMEILSASAFQMPLKSPQSRLSVGNRASDFPPPWLHRPAPSARIGDGMMQPDNLHSLKDDMIAFIEGHGMKRLPGFVMEDVASVLWEDDQNPDSWKDFVEMAKAVQSPFVTMSDITLEKEDLQSLLEDLRDFNFPDEMPDSEEVEELVNYVGKTGFVQLGFAHQGIMFLHESSTEWYDRYQQLLESLETVSDIVIDEDADEE
jgi:hypothetical protein